MAKAKKKAARPLVKKSAAKKAATTKLPKIGATLNGGRFAGITLHDGKAMALVLLPGTFTGNWANAGAWAAKKGGGLPNRHDALVLYDNLKKQFEERWYWTSVVHPGYADCAFVRYFGNGAQSYVRKDGDYRARAVRRVAI